MMEKVFCPICGKEYKDVNMHIRKGHDRDPEEVIEEAFGHRLSPSERQKGTAQTRRVKATKNRLSENSSRLQRTHKRRMEEMENAWRKRFEEYDTVMKKRIKDITGK